MTLCQPFPHFLSPCVFILVTIIHDSMYVPKFQSTIQVMVQDVKQDTIEETGIIPDIIHDTIQDMIGDTVQ